MAYQRLTDRRGVSDRQFVRTTIDKLSYARDADVIASQIELAQFSPAVGMAAPSTTY